MFIWTQRHEQNTNNIEMNHIKPKQATKHGHRRFYRNVIKTTIHKGYFCFFLRTWKGPRTTDTEQLDESMKINSHILMLFTYKCTQIFYIIEKLFILKILFFRKYFLRQTKITIKKKENLWSAPNVFFLFPFLAMKGSNSMLFYFFFFQFNSPTKFFQ